jgi:hypothetical protein
MVSVFPAWKKACLLCYACASSSIEIILKGVWRVSPFLVQGSQQQTRLVERSCQERRPATARDRHTSPKSTSEKIMTRNGNGFSNFAKRLFVGGLLGAAVALLYAPRSGIGLRSDIPQGGVRFQRRFRPLARTRVDESIESGNLVKPSIGWLAVFYVASAVAVISRLRMKKT